MSGRMVITLQQGDTKVMFKSRCSLWSNPEDFIAEMKEYTDWGKKLTYLNEKYEENQKQEGIKISADDFSKYFSKKYNRDIVISQEFADIHSVYRYVLVDGKRSNDKELIDKIYEEIKSWTINTSG